MKRKRTLSFIDGKLWSQFVSSVLVKRVFNWIIRIDVEFTKLLSSANYDELYHLVLDWHALLSQKKITVIIKCYYVG